MDNTSEGSRKDAWRHAFGADKAPDDDIEILKKFYESSIFGGIEPIAPAAMARFILEKTDDSPEDNDLSEFFEDGKVRPFFWKALTAYFEASQPSIEDSEAAEDEGDDDVDAFSPVDARAVMYGVGVLFNMVTTKQLDLNPPWQRTVVWSGAKQKDLIKSILLGVPIPSIILHQDSKGDSMHEQYAIIDGKQRLSAIYGFLTNQFKLPAFKVPPGHPLHSCRNRWYDSPDEKKKSLDAIYRNRIQAAQLPVLLFRDVGEGRLRQIFNLYNVTATRLNAAEIRNAAYQNNAIHRALFILAGEGAAGQRLPYLSAEKQDLFQAVFRNALTSTKRFGAVDFLCRYLGYSRAAVEQGRQFAGKSTAIAANRYFDLMSLDDNPEAVVLEIIRVFEKAQQYFDLPDFGDDGHRAFYRENFEALQATTSMVCARLLDRVEVLGVATKPQIEAAVLQTLDDEPYPPKGSQQTKEIWNHQARRYLGLVERLGLDLVKFDGGLHKAFADRMGQVRLP
jgi:hypothetical protein